MEVATLTVSLSFVAAASEGIAAESSHSASSASVHDYNATITGMLCTALVSISACEVADAHVRACE
eukprot:6197622-Pleurochrysis_carterae.AAC.2